MVYFAGDFPPDRFGRFFFRRQDHVRVDGAELTDPRVNLHELPVQVLQFPELRNLSFRLLDRC